MATLELDEHDAQPLYWQLYWQLRRQILAGELLPGSRLPASRPLARQLGVARVTVLQALEQLAAEGYVETRPGAGTFVTPGLPLESPQTDPSPAPFAPRFSAWGQRVMAAHRLPEPASPLAPRRREAAPARSDGEIDFGFGRAFSHIFPYDVWRRLLARYLSTDDIILARYGSVAGFLPLRQALADHLRRMRGLHCRPQQVVVVSGAQQTLDILARLLLRARDTVVVETPGYRDAFEVFRVNGARLRAVPVDEHGLPVEQLSADERARLLFVTPSNQFPRGGTMPLHRRLQLLQWARDQDALIVEDDYDGELRYDGRPHTALQGLDRDGRVVYLGTFSKVLFPALRLAYVVLPPALVTPFLRARRLVDRGAPTLTQAAVADFIHEGHFERHLRHLREVYGQRRQALVAALARYLPDRVQYAAAPAGLHVMLYLEPGCDEAAVLRRAAARGVRAYPGAPYHLQQPAPPTILLGFSSLNEAEIDAGVRRLAAALDG